MEHHIDPWLGIFFPYLNFAIFFILAIYFFRKPASNAPKKKLEDFERIKREAFKVKEDAAKKLDELNQRRANLQKEITEMQTMAKQAADLEAEKIISDAQRVAKHLKEEAKRIAEAEVLKARGILRKEIIELVKVSVEEKIKSDIDDVRHLKIIDSQVSGLDKLSL